jgi:Ca-activated chloride channel homolog
VNRARRGLAAAAATLLLLVTAAGCDKRDDGARAPSAAVPFSVLAGSELKELEPAITDAARAVGVDLRMSYAGTLDIVERINAGERFDAILPPNGAYPALALKTPPVAREKLFYSRIAIGVKAPKAAALGWDRRAPGWAEIAKAAGGGQLRYAMTNPTSSNTGMSALFAVASASAGKSEDLTVADVKPEVLSAFLAGQVLTAGSSGWLAEAYAKDPSRIDAMVNYEAVILRTNQRLGAADQLVPIYPRDGMISADYPLMLLDDTRRDTYTKLIGALKGTAFQRDALSSAFLRPANPDVPAAPVLPTAAVAELSFPNRLEVIDAVLGAYQASWRRPATSIFVLDVSKSMEGARLGAMREALKVLSGADDATLGARLASFQQRERVVLITFAGRVAEPVWIRFDADRVGAAREEIRRRADALQLESATAVFSALAKAQEVAREERRRDPERYVSIALLTDGESNAGIGFDEFRSRYPAGTAPARVFPILFGEGNVAQMHEVAALTGGREFDGRNVRLAQVFREIRGYQ